MACDGCNTKSKILFGVGGILGLVGAILMIVAATAGSEGLKVGFEAENQQTVTLTVETGKGGLGYALHIKASDHGSCESIKDGTTITKPSGASGSDPYLFDGCHEIQSEWEAENDPALRKLGHWFLTDNSGAKVYGDYTISSSVPVWVVDSGEELGEAVGGIMAMLGLFVVAVVIFVVSCILCCVGCCCMGKE